MFEYTEQLLINKIGLDAFQKYNTASDLLAQYDSDATNEYIENYIIGADDIQSEDDIIDNIDKIFNESLILIIGDFDIMLNDDLDIPLDFLNTMLISLSKIDDYDDSNSIINIIESQDSSSEEKLADILSLVSIMSPDYYLFYIKSVSEHFFQRTIKSIGSSTFTIEEEINEDESKNEIKYKIIKKLKSIIKNFNENLYAIKYIKANPEIGLKFDTYMNLVLGDLLQDNYGFLAENLFIFASISEDGYNNQLKFLYDKLNEIIPDSYESGKIYEKINNIFLKVNENDKQM